MRFCRETVEGVASDILPLIEKHYSEIARYPDIPLDPDFHHYKQLERIGVLRVFTTRTDLGSLIGYGVFILRSHPHQKTTLQAFQDLLFIDPDHRGFGVSFIGWIDHQLKAEGVQVTFHTVTERFDFSSLLLRMGYELTEKTFSRRL